MGAEGGTSHEGFPLRRGLGLGIRQGGGKGRMEKRRHSREAVAKAKHSYSVNQQICTEHHGIPSKESLLWRCYSIRDQVLLHRDLSSAEAKTVNNK